MVINHLLNGMILQLDFPRPSLWTKMATFRQASTQKPTPSSKRRRRTANTPTGQVVSSKNRQLTLRETNIAMEIPPFVDVFPGVDVFPIGISVDFHCYASLTGG